MRHLVKTLILSVILALTCQSVYAAEVTISDSINAELTVTVRNRTAGERVNIFAVKQGTALSDAESDVTKLEHQGSMITSGAGTDSYSFRLKLPVNFISATYTVYVSGETPVSEDIFYVSFDTTLAKVKEICGKTDVMNETQVSEVKSLLQTYKKEMAIDYELFNNANIDSVARGIMKSVAASSITFDDGDNTAGEPEDYTIAADGVKEFQDRIKKLSVLSCFENINNKSILFDLNNSFLYAAETAALDFAGQTGVTLDTLKVSNQDAGAETGISNKGASDIIDMLFGLKYNSPDELKLQYAKAIIVSYIKNNLSDGYGFVSEALTTQNASVAGISIPDYLALTDKNAANNNIVLAKDTITTSNLVQKIVDSIPDASSEVLPEYNENTSWDSGSSGGLSGGGIVVPKKETEPVTGNDGSLADVKNHWAEAEIEYLREKGILNGYGDGTFLPDNTMLREEAAKILAVAFDLVDENTDVDFADMNKTDWFYVYVSSLVSKGVISGVDEDNFGTGETITREQFVVMLYRLMGLAGTQTDVEIIDINTVNEYAVEAVKYFYANGIVTGFEDGSFRPQEPLTRAQTAKLVYSLLMKEDAE